MGDGLTNRPVQLKVQAHLVASTTNRSSAAVDFGAVRVRVSENTAAMISPSANTKPVMVAGIVILATHTHIDYYSRMSGSLH